MTVALDPTDRALLDALQADARAPQAALGARVGLSTAAVNRRLRRLVDEGVIAGSAVTVAPELVGRPVTVIAHVAVESEQLEKVGNVLHIHALILVEREGQKKILIGDGGARMKKNGQDARLDMQKLVGSRVMLNLRVKSKPGSCGDERAPKSLGYRLDCA